MKAVVKAIVIFAVVFVVIQFIPGVGRRNPANHTIVVPPPAEVQQVLRRACYDCHSNETEWPAASRVAPVAWAVESHVYGGRAKLNLSFWPDDPHAQDAAKRKISRMLAADRMPLKSYRLANVKGRLSEQERQLLQQWADSPSLATPLHEAAVHGTQGAVAR